MSFGGNARPAADQKPVDGPEGDRPRETALDLAVDELGAPERMLLDHLEDRFLCHVVQGAGAASVATRLVFEAPQAVEPVGAKPAKDRFQGDRRGLAVHASKHVAGDLARELPERRTLGSVKKRGDRRVPPERKFRCVHDHSSFVRGGLPGTAGTVDGRALLVLWRCQRSGSKGGVEHGKTEAGEGSEDRPGASELPITSSNGSKINHDSTCVDPEDGMLGFELLPGDEEFLDGMSPSPREGRQELRGIQAPLGVGKA